MLRFAFVTDSHVGSDADGYQLQPRYVRHEATLFDALGQWLRREKASFVVHGGDLTDHGSLDEIQQGVQLCARLPVPTYLCLGNHDLAQPASLAMWRKHAPQLLPGGDDVEVIDTTEARLVLVHHHWHAGVAHHWRPELTQEPRLNERQVQTVSRFVEASDRPVIAITHAPLHAVSATQCGQGEPFHQPHPPYAAAWRRIAGNSGRLRMVLCGHNHVTSFADQGRFVSSSTAALNEPPAQVRLITVDEDTVRVATHMLSQDVPLPSQWNAEHAWCAGPGEAQRFSIPTGLDSPTVVPG